MTPNEIQIAVALARYRALRAVREQRKRQGLRQTLPMSTLSALAAQWLTTHPELYAEAAADPLVRELGKGR